MSTLKRIAAEWNRNAPARCRQLDEGKDISHDKILIPSIIGLSKGLGGKDVLDVGCGCGVLSSLASARARRVLAIDISHGMISEARKRFGSRRNLEFSVISVEALAKSFRGQFDVCLSNMSVVTMPNLQRALLSVSKLLKPSGRFVFSITHPCFWNLYRRDEPPEAFNYWKAHPVTAPFRITMDQNPLVSPTTYFHRSVADYIQSLRIAGFQIERVEEPKVPSRVPIVYRRSFTLPRFMLFSVCKVP